MRERIVATSLAVAIAFGTAACGGKTPIGYAAKEGSEASENEVPMGSGAEAQKSADFTPGVVNGNTYENSFFNVKITVPEDMTFLDEDGLAKMNEAIGEYAGNETAQKANEASGTTIVAYADRSDFTSFNVSISSPGKLTTWAFDEKSIVEGGKEMAVENLKNSGVNDIDAEIREVTFLGEKHYSLVISGDSASGEFHSMMLVLLRDGYIATLTVGGPSEDCLSIFDNADKLH